jgi:hypothetical protein
MTANVESLIQETGSVRGVRYVSTDGWHEVRGTDGWYATTPSLRLSQARCDITRDSLTDQKEGPHAPWA